MTSRGKNEDVNEKLEKMSHEFSIPKSGYTEISMKICGKKFLTHILGHFWLIKTKMKIKKHGKMSSIFEFFISNLGYVAVFIKIWEKSLTRFLRHVLLIEAKMKMMMKKYGKICSIFEFSILKLGYEAIFMKVG